MACCGITQGDRHRQTRGRKGEMTIVLIDCGPSAQFHSWGELLPFTRETERERERERIEI